MLKLSPCAAVLALALIASPALAGDGHGHGGHSHDGHGHAHDHDHGKMRMIPDGHGAASITLAASEDTMSGYNLQLIIDNFTFSPQHTGQKTDAVEGHAHLYINDEKVGRVYSDWVHIPAAWLQEGENTVRVSLNDNEHAPWGQDDEALEATVTLMGHGMKAGHGDSHAAHSN
ncbi:MAG: hypothetical protein AAGE76_10920 [Pseudomonadota bacterium]